MAIRRGLLAASGTLGALFILVGCGVIAEEKRYFEAIEPYAEQFVQDREDYNEHARRADRLKSVELYERQVQAARDRERSASRQLAGLRSVTPPETLERYHELLLEVVALTVDFCAEIQVAYDPAKPRSVTASAYARALEIHGQINDLQELQEAEFERLGYK